MNLIAKYNKVDTLGREPFSEPLLDERLLRLFDAIYTTRSVTRAAEKLGQAQPTVSIWLARLRRELDDPLFVRTLGGMEPTPRADELIGPTRAAITCLRRLRVREEVFSPAASQRRFRLCMSDASHITLLPRLLARIRREAPGVQLEAVQNDAATASRLASGEADLALGLVTDLGTGFFQQTLYLQDWVCLVSAHHPRLHAGLTRADYGREAHVAIERGTGHDLIQEALARVELRRSVALTLPGFLGLGALVSETDLIATLPRHIAETLAAVHPLTVHACPIDVAPFLVKQHWHARNHHDAGLRWLRGLCCQLFQKRSTGRDGEQRASTASPVPSHSP